MSRISRVEAARSLASLQAEVMTSSTKSSATLRMICHREKEVSSSKGLWGGRMILASLTYLFSFWGQEILHTGTADLACEFVEFVSREHAAVFAGFEHVAWHGGDGGFAHLAGHTDSGATIKGWAGGWHGDWAGSGDIEVLGDVAAFLFLRRVHEAGILGRMGVSGGLGLALDVVGVVLWEGGLRGEGEVAAAAAVL